MDGGTGWTLAAILTVTVLDFFGASGSASSTSTDQTGSPFSLSMSWTFVSRVDLLEVVDRGDVGDEVGPEREDLVVSDLEPAGECHVMSSSSWATLRRPV